MRKAVTLFLILVLSIQVLPVRQMGRMLFGNQFTEELPHSTDTGKDDCCKELKGKSDFLTSAGLSISPVITHLSVSHLHFADAIPANHTGDIHVPPPNCAAV